MVENPSLFSTSLPLSLPLLQHPSRGRNTDRRGPLAPRSSRVALKSFPRSSRSPLAAVGRWCKGGTQGGGLLLLSVSLTSSRLGCKFSPRPLLTATLPPSLPLASPFPSHAAVREFPRQSVHPPRTNGGGGARDRVCSYLRSPVRSPTATDSAQGRSREMKGAPPLTSRPGNKSLPAVAPSPQCASRVERGKRKGRLRLSTEFGDAVSPPR